MIEAPRQRHERQPAPGEGQDEPAGVRRDRRGAKRCNIKERIGIEAADRPPDPFPAR